MQRGKCLKLTEHAASDTIKRFLRGVVSAKKVWLHARRVRRVHESAAVIQGFFRAVLVRRQFRDGLRLSRRIRHEHLLESYLQYHSEITLSEFLPRRQKEEENECLIRKLMLLRGVTYSNACEIVAGSVGTATLPVESVRVKGNRDQQYGAFCNSRIVISRDDTSDSDDESIDAGLLNARRPGRLPPLV